MTMHSCGACEPKSFDRVELERADVVTELDGAGGDSLRHDWTVAEVRALHDLPLFELVDRARAVHTEHHAKNQVQLCTLLSVKTGGCPEDCAYCPQSSHYDTPVKGE